MTFDPDQFERVIAYYRDCVVQDSGRSIRLPLSDQGRTFIPLKLASEWTSSEKDELSAKLTSENARFASELRQRPASAEIMYGYPILIDPHRANVVPVFLQPVGHDPPDDELTVRLTHDWPEINDEFSRSIGVTGREGRNQLLDELGIAEDAELPPEGLTHFARRLAELGLSTEIEPIDPKCIPRVPTLRDIKFQGLVNRHILVIADRPQFTAGLKRELSSLSKRSHKERVNHTALRYFFGAIPSSGETAGVDSKPDQRITEVVPLNEEQRSAVQSAFRDDLTVVTGPPGTGKSQIVTTVIANAWMREQSVLFASHNHKAVDVVEERVNDLASKPLMIRTGRRAGHRELRNEIISYLANALESPVTEQDRQDLSDTHDEIKQLENKRKAVWKALEDVRVRRNRVYQLDEQIPRLKSERANLDKRFVAAQQFREHAEIRLNDEVGGIQRNVEELGRERDDAQTTRDSETAAINLEIEDLLTSVELLHRKGGRESIDEARVEAEFISDMTRKYGELSSLKQRRELETRTRNAEMASSQGKLDPLIARFDSQQWSRQKDQDFAALRKLILNARFMLATETDRSGSIWSRIWKRWGRTARFQRIAGLTTAWTDEYDILGAPPSDTIVAKKSDLWALYLSDALTKLSEWERDAERNCQLAEEIYELENAIDKVEAEFDEKEFGLREAELENDLFQRVQVQIGSLHERIDNLGDKIKKANDAFERMEFDKRIAERHGEIERRRTEHESEHGAKLAKLDASRADIQRDIANRSRQFDEAAAALTKLPMVNDLAVELKHVENQIWDAGERLINASMRVLPDHFDIDTRRAIDGFRAVFEQLRDDQLGGARYRKLMHEMERLFPTVMAALPSWCVTNLSARGNIPLHAGLFDLVVIDEASQCDIPSALPLLYRAKRALIIGDLNQLRHITSINPRRDQKLQEKYGLNTAADQTFAFSQNSLFDAATGKVGKSSLHSLREHFRSHADIIGFSNQNWYNDRLLVCTDYNDLHIPAGQESGIRWHNVNGRVERSTTHNGNINRREAEELSKQVIDLIADRGFRGSVGIVTPFRAQANLIRSIINQRLETSDEQRCDLITDTAPAFQGDEKDVVFFSPCVEFQMPSGAEWFIRETGNLFNVAITRPRALLLVVGNLEACLASKIPHVKGFAEFCDKTLKGKEAPDDSSGFVDGPTIGHWEKPFYKALQTAGMKPMHQYAEGQYRLDFAFETENTKLNIEVDGEMYHREWDGSRSRNDLMRDHRLIGMGWKVKRFWVYQLRDNMDQCVAETKELLL